MKNSPDDLSSKLGRGSAALRGFASKCADWVKEKLPTKTGIKGRKSEKKPHTSHGIYLAGKKKDESEPALAKIVCHGLTSDECICEYLGRENFPFGRRIGIKNVHSVFFAQFGGRPAALHC